jgi:hypothetical protein
VVLCRGASAPRLQVPATGAAPQAMAFLDSCI